MGSCCTSSRDGKSEMNFDTQLCTEIGEWFDEEHKGMAETLTRFHERN